MFGRWLGQTAAAAADDGDGEDRGRGRANELAFDVGHCCVRPLADLLAAGNHNGQSKQQQVMALAVKWHASGRQLEAKVRPAERERSRSLEPESESEPEGRISWRNCCVLTSYSGGLMSAR